MSDRIQQAFENFMSEIEAEQKSILQEENPSPESAADFAAKNIGDIEAMNRAVGGTMSNQVESAQLTQALINFTAKEGRAPMPSLQKVDACAARLMQTHENPASLGSLCSSAASACEILLKQSPSSAYVEKINWYYSTAIHAMVESSQIASQIDGLEGQKTIIFCGLAGILCNYSVFIDRYHHSFQVDPSIVCNACRSALELGEYETARVAAKNFTYLYRTYGCSQDKGYTVYRVLLDVYKAIIDKSLDHDLGTYIDAAQDYAQKSSDNEGFWYAAYFAEHSKKESERYRNYNIAYNNYNYAKYALASLHNMYGEKAYIYAKKFPFDDTCRKIVAEYKKENRA